MADVHKVFLFGLDRAGKTAMGETIKKGKVVTETKPTLAFNIGKMLLNDLTFQIWDAPGQVPFRKTWQNGFEKAKVLLFLCDTSDFVRFEESKKEFDNVIKNPETNGVPLIFCFHKMDLDVSKEHYSDARGVFKLPFITDRKVTILETSIFDPASIKKVQDALEEIIISSRF